MDKRRDLNIATSSGKPGFLSAASGVVKLGKRVFVIADDATNLAEFSLDNLNQPGILHSLIPQQVIEGEQWQPDFESLVYLPEDCFPPGGALLAVPSGKTPEKYTGVVVPLSEAGQPGAPRRVDFSSLYASLKFKLKSLNVEGAVCTSEHVYFFQRGDNNGGRNAIIAIHHDRFLDCLKWFSSVESISLMSITDCELGAIAGARLGFTDAASLGDGRIVFTAAAEQNGNCAGFAIGMMSKEFEILKLKQFDRGPRIEGIFAEALQPPLLWLVFDNASPEAASCLYTTVLE